MGLGLAAEVLGAACPVLLQTQMHEAQTGLLFMILFKFL